jgi:predicted RNA-binding Zn-ribbon protein involved in translation (DUF1610 family)
MRIPGYRRSAARWSARRVALNRWGDAVCPTCGVNAITPAGCVLQGGILRCPWCGAVSRLSAARAARGNRRADASGSALASTVCCPSS